VLYNDNHDIFCVLVSVCMLLFSSFAFRVADPSQKENLGIIVQYKVKVKLCLGALGGYVYLSISLSKCVKVLFLRKQICCIISYTAFPVV
jgi:hypothetical protein